MIKFFFSLALSVFIFASPAQAQHLSVGYRNVSHSFEVISNALSSELEESYDFFFIINAAEGRTPLNAFIPNQHMLIVEKGQHNRQVFERDSSGTITDVLPGTRQLQAIVGHQPYRNAQQNHNSFGLPFDWNGLEVLPISTGTLYHMPTFSGIFQINWPRSLTMHNTDPEAPMSNQVYVGYFYHDDSIARQNWTSKNRDKVSYAAIHGTPEDEWETLGRARGSHGCARMHPSFMEGIYRAIHHLPEKSVMELDWDFDLPRIDQSNPTAVKKPVLIMIFNGFEGKSS